MQNRRHTNRNGWQHSGHFQDPRLRSGFPGQPSARDGRSTYSIPSYSISSLDSEWDEEFDRIFDTAFPSRTRRPTNTFGFGDSDSSTPYQQVNRTVTYRTYSRRCPYVTVNLSGNARATFSAPAEPLDDSMNTEGMTTEEYNERYCGDQTAYYQQFSPDTSQYDDEAEEGEEREERQNESETVVEPIIIRGGSYHVGRVVEDGRVISESTWSTVAENIRREQEANFRNQRQASFSTEVDSDTEGVGQFTPSTTTTDRED